MGISVLIKGLKKTIDFPDGTSVEAIEQHIKGNWENVERISGLPMDAESVAARRALMPFDPVIEARRVFQGSPHKHEGKLDASKIGTGEGGRAYGHGHYVAEEKGVAEEYKRTLTGRASHPQQVFLKRSNFNEVLKSKVEKLKRSGALTDNSEFKANMDAMSEARIVVDGKAYNIDAFTDEVLDGNLAVKDFPELDQGSGYLYEFDLNESAIDNMLDWDAPISEQPERIRIALAPITEKVKKLSPEYVEIIDSGDIKGEGLYRLYSEYVGGNAAAASEALREVGIPGIKYFDGGSRFAGEGTRNFVIFPGSEKQIKALSRNGELLPALAGAVVVGGGVMASDDAEAGVLSQAFKIAQKNAAKPLSEGGLGLPANNTAQDRAKAMGFDIDQTYYHGTDSPKFESFDDDYIGSNHGDQEGFFFSDNIDIAEGHGGRVEEVYLRSKKPVYIDMSRPTNFDLEKYGEYGFHGHSVTSFYDNNVDDLLWDARLKDADSIKITDGDSTNIAVFDNQHIRSVHAAFDPAKRNSPDLLASVGGISVLGAGALSANDAEASPLPNRISDITATGQQRPPKSLLEQAIGLGREATSEETKPPKPEMTLGDLSRGLTESALTIGSGLGGVSVAGYLQLLGESEAEAYQDVKNEVPQYVPKTKEGEVVLSKLMDSMGDMAKVNEFIAGHVGDTNKAMWDLAGKPKAGEAHRSLSKLFVELFSPI